MDITGTLIDQYDLKVIDEDPELKKLYTNFLRWKIKAATTDIKSEYAAMQKPKEEEKKKETTW